MPSSQCLLYGRTSGTHRWDAILVHSSTQSSTLEDYMGLCYDLWSLVLSIDSIDWFKSGDWMDHSSSFVFFLQKQEIQSKSSLGCVFGITVFLKYPSLFHLHLQMTADFSNWECLDPFFHLFLGELYYVCPHHNIPTSNLHSYGVFGVMYSSSRHFWSSPQVNLSS